MIVEILLFYGIAVYALDFESPKRLEVLFKEAALVTVNTPHLTRLGLEYTMIPSITGEGSAALESTVKTVTETALIQSVKSHRQHKETTDRSSLRFGRTIKEVKRGVVTGDPNKFALLAVLAEAKSPASLETKAPIEGTRTSSSRMGVITSRDSASTLRPKRASALNQQSQTNPVSTELTSGRLQSLSSKSPLQSFRQSSISDGVETLATTSRSFSLGSSQELGENTNDAGFSSSIDLERSIEPSEDFKGLPANNSNYSSAKSSNSSEFNSARMQNQTSTGAGPSSSGRLTKKSSDVGPYIQVTTPLALAVIIFSLL